MRMMALICCDRFREGIVTTAAGGNSSVSGADGAATNVHIDFAKGVAVDSIGGVYFADTTGRTVRYISSSGNADSNQLSSWDVYKTRAQAMLGQLRDCMPPRGRQMELVRQLGSRLSALLLSTPSISGCLWVTTPISERLIYPQV